MLNDQFILTSTPKRSEPNAQIVSPNLSPIKNIDTKLFMQQQAINSEVSKVVQETVSFIVDNVVGNVFKEYKRQEEELYIEERRKRNISLSEIKAWGEIFNHQSATKKLKFHDDSEDSIVFIKEVPAVDKHIGLDDSFNRGDDTELIAALKKEEEKEIDHIILSSGSE